MPAPSVKIWLKRRAVAEMAGNYSMGLVTTVAACVALAITYAILWILSTSALPVLYVVAYDFRGLESSAPSPEAHYYAAGIALALMFIIEFAVRRDRKANPWREFQTMNSIEADYLAAILRLITSAILIGPTLVGAAWNFFHTAAAWREMNIDLCSQVVQLLLSRTRRVPLEELIRTIPGFDSTKTVEQLRMIAGVVFLPSPPAGISLTNDLRDELGGFIPPEQEQFRSRDDRLPLVCPECGQKMRIRLFLVGSSVRCPRCRTQYRTAFDLRGGVRLEREHTRQQRRERVRVTTDHRTRSPYDILGVPRTASVHDIKRAYHKLMKQHHPDVVGGSDPKTRQQAEDKTKEINRAYHELLDNHEPN